VAGHSKWANIKRRKARVDEQRGKVFTKLGRELFVATRQGGPNPDANLRLRIAVQKAREANMPMEHIQRSILKAAGELEGVSYEEIVFEGYGPGGVAILVEGTTDNRKRTVAEIRYIFSRNGGNLGEAGCVSWLFEPKGLLVVEAEGLTVDEDDLTLLALDAGAQDVRNEGDSYAIITGPGEFEAAKTRFESAGITVAHAEFTRLPRSVIEVAGETQEAVDHLVELLDEHDDVQAVYANAQPVDADA
jgi:YebC/PmpR family DNA-binding regulatory protein